MSAGHIYVYKRIIQIVHFLLVDIARWSQTIVLKRALFYKRYENEMANSTLKRLKEMPQTWGHLEDSTINEIIKILVYYKEECGHSTYINEIRVNETFWLFISVCDFSWNLQERNMKMKGTWE